jgi:hypothetical protein
MTQAENFQKPHVWERMSGELQGVLERGRGRSSLGTASNMIINLIRSSISEVRPDAHLQACNPHFKSPRRYIHMQRWPAHLLCTASTPLTPECYTPSREFSLARTHSGLHGMQDGTRHTLAERMGWKGSPVFVQIEHEPMPQLHAHRDVVDSKRISREVLCIRFDTREFAVGRLANGAGEPSMRYKPWLARRGMRRVDVRI